MSMGRARMEQISGGEVLSPEQTPGLMYSRGGRPGGDTPVISGLQAFTHVVLSRASFRPSPVHQASHPNTSSAWRKATRFRKPSLPAACP